MSISRRQFLAGSGGAGLAALGGGVCPNPAAAQDAKFFRIASGPTESSLFQAGTLIGQVVSSPPGARDCARGGSCGVPGMIAVNQTTAGSLANLELLTTGKIDSVLCQSDLAYAAFTGKGTWRGKAGTDKLRVLAYLYPETLHVIVRKSAKIGDLRGLRGKAVSLGERESGMANNARALLAAAGVQERDLRAQYLKTAEAIEAMKAGKLDAFFETAVVPSSLVRELAADQDITLLPLGGLVARLRQELPFLTETTIPADAYPDTPETKAVSVGILWVVN
ncbi:MAG: TAXI family TRAP transporter solute-binding subunit, partial [Proteobacteria bacterium]|nr:TAXI family TRAP transporter solute-binding subunit [Pseudomonadota bacterium]